MRAMQAKSRQGMMGIGFLYAAVAAVLLFAPSAARAAVTLTFSGTCEVFGNSVYGLSGDAVPFSYQMTYDPALDTNNSYFPTGAMLGDYPAAHEFYGYSA